ncbi:MAG: hypothetical protein IJM26_06640, partial [Lachnospiraceae bacterium]|nr:hypothetical protein [Lachnospiraceae bacterium]
MADTTNRRREPERSRVSSERQRPSSGRPGQSSSRSSSRSASGSASRSASGSASRQGRSAKEANAWKRLLQTMLILPIVNLYYEMLFRIVTGREFVGFKI